MAIKAFSYLRFSSAAQAAGDSLRRQLALAEEWAAKHPEIELDTTTRDLGVSAYKGEHRVKGALAAFLKRVEQGQIPPGSFLLIEAFDRLSRENETVAINLLTANAMQVFFHTHPHNGDPWYHGQRSFEIEPTSDSFALIRQAVRAGRSMWKPRTRYAKAGVILIDLQAERDAPLDLLPTTDAVRSEKLMTALDAVNARFGRGTLRPGGISQTTSWSTRANNRSPRYTTRFSDLMEVHA